MAEETWPGLRIRSFSLESTGSGPLYQLLVQDGQFVAEVGRLGHGLQVWLQAIWFLSRLGPGTPTLVLDEPDVYLHADLQRRLIRRLLKLTNQIVITTHSVEILSEVNTENVIIVDKSKNVSKFASSLSAVQRLVDSLGGGHNLTLSRLWTSKKLILVEGKDITLLKAIHKTMFPNTERSLDMIPNMPIGGWGGWNYAVGSNMLLKNSTGEKIKTFCILDSDLRSPEEIQKRIQDAKNKNVDIHIWSKRELENYIIAPSAISRIIRREGKKVPENIHEIVCNQLRSIAKDLKQEITLQMAELYQQANRGTGVKTALRHCEKEVAKKWASDEDQMSLAPGKDVISQLSHWSQGQYQSDLSPIRICRELRLDEIPQEMKNVITRLEEI